MRHDVSKHLLRTLQGPHSSLNGFPLISILEGHVICSYYDFTLGQVLDLRL